MQEERSKSLRCTLCIHWRRSPSSPPPLALCCVPEAVLRAQDSARPPAYHPPEFIADLAPGLPRRPQTVALRLHLLERIWCVLVVSPHADPAKSRFCPRPGFRPRAPEARARWRQNFANRCTTFLPQVAGYILIYHALRSAARGPQGVYRRGAVFHHWRGRGRLQLNSRDALG
jgi:hypothetical protein